jgi:hypothetical protein
MKFKCLLIAFALVMATALSALATTPNPAPGSTGYTPMVIPIMGVYSSNQTIVKWKSPAGYRVVHASATARAVTGTNPTLTVDVKSGATSMFSSPISVTAGSITDAVLGTAPNLADEGTISVDFAKGGSYTSGQGWRDVSLFLLLKSR